MLAEFSAYLVETVFELGYVGIFLLMAIESSFIPFPSEVVLIPAGFLAYQGEMNVVAVVGSGIAGSLFGAYVNYYLALFLGRGFLRKYGQYFFISSQTLTKMDTFFLKHGSISTFTGRLVPGVRQLISIPAGLCKMNLKKFTLYSALGSGIWAAILVGLGYVIGDNQELLQHNLKEITLAVVVVVGLIIFWYTFKNKKENNETNR